MSEPLTPEEIAELKAAFLALDPVTLPASGRAFCKFYARMLGVNEGLLILARDREAEVHTIIGELAPLFLYYEKKTGTTLPVSELAALVKWIIAELRSAPLPDVLPKP